MISEAGWLVEPWAIWHLARRVYTCISIPQLLFNRLLVTDWPVARVIS